MPCRDTPQLQHRGMVRVGPSPPPSAQPEQTGSVPASVVNQPLPTVLFSALRAPPALMPLPPCLLATLRTDCAEKGIPATVALWLPRASAFPPEQRAVLLQRLILALPDDCTLASPQHALPGAAGASEVAREVADAVYRGDPYLKAPAHYPEYRQALTCISDAIAGCGCVMPGSYGFIRQSRAARQMLVGNLGAERLRTILCGWINWQWAALSAVHADPLMMDAAGPDRARPLCLAYALDDPSRDASQIRMLLSREVALPPLAAPTVDRGRSEVPEPVEELAFPRAHPQAGPPASPLQAGSASAVGTTTQFGQ